MRTFCGLEKEAAKYSRKRNIILGILYNVYFLPKLCNDIGLTLHSAICTDNGGYKVDCTLHKYGKPQKRLFLIVAGPLRGRGDGLATKKSVFLKLLAKSLFFDKLRKIGKEQVKNTDTQKRQKLLHP